MYSDEQFERFASLTSDLESINRDSRKKIKGAIEEIEFLHRLEDDFARYNKRARRILYKAKETLAKINLNNLI